MPIFGSKPPPFKPRNRIAADYNTFRRGLNLLLRPTELKRDELAQADNIMLVGSGVPTGRWGISTYFLANSTGSVRGFGTFVNNASSINEIFALTDQGYLAKKNGTSSTVISGLSYPSGSVIRSEQLGGYSYIVSKDAPFARYRGGSLEVFATLSAPTNLTATNFSGATGSYTWSWIVTTQGQVGETTGSTNKTLSGLPQFLSDTQVNLGWTLQTGNITGYGIYRGLVSDETFLAAVGPSVSQYIDRGEAASQTIYPPLTNSTGGVKSQFIKKYNDRLLAVDKSDPTKLLISARYPNQNKFNWADGGGYIYVDPDSGEDITGIAVQPGTDKIIVYKGFSHYAVTLGSVQIGNFIVLDPSYQPISTSVGACNQDVIQTVENDTFYFGRKGMYVTGFEPNFLNLIRTNEISARIRPYLALLSDADYANACAFYVNNKYILSFPNRKECMVYDRERGAFVGPWITPFGISSMIKIVDASGTERWVLGSAESNQVYEFNTSINTDNGTAIQKTIRTNKESYGEWNLMKIINFFYALFRNVSGTVTVNVLVENRDGTTSTAKTFTIEGSAVSGSLGWGIDGWGDSVNTVGESDGGSGWGQSGGTVVSGGDEIPRATQLFKSVRLTQVEIITTSANSNFELLNLKLTANVQGEGSIPTSWRV